MSVVGGALGQPQVLTPADWGFSGQEGGSWGCVRSWAGQEQRLSSCEQKPSRLVLMATLATATTGPLTSRSPCPPPPSLVEVLLGSELLLSVFQKDRECVICCCLSCRETKEESQGLPLPRPAPAHFGDQNSATVLKVSAVGRWDTAKDGEGLPWEREGVSSPRKSDERIKRITDHPSLSLLYLSRGLCCREVPLLELLEHEYLTVV